MGASRLTRIIVALGGVVILQACSSFGDTLSGLRPPPKLEYYADDEALDAAKNEFHQGNYGHAQHYYEQAVNYAPNDAEAWLGLAASFDRLHRFDDADKAYRKVAALIGDRPELYNNLGYSQLLRGNLVQARRYFLKAYELDPQNETIANNLELLRSSVNYPQRG
jgi:Flp pilus assembly protein TadD